MIATMPSKRPRIPTSFDRYGLFTKWQEAYAIPNQEPLTVAESLVITFFCRFGVPRTTNWPGRNLEPWLTKEVFQRLVVARHAPHPCICKRKAWRNAILVTKWPKRTVVKSSRRTRDIKTPNYPSSCLSTGHPPLKLHAWSPGNLILPSTHEWPRGRSFGSGRQNKKLASGRKKNHYDSLANCVGYQNWLYH
jgi:hypothetical protein